MALEPPAGLGGSEMLSRGRGVKNGLQGGRMATYPPPRPPMHGHKLGCVKTLIVNTITQTKEKVVLTQIL